MEYAHLTGRPYRVFRCAAAAAPLFASKQVGALKGDPNSVLSLSHLVVGVQ